MLMFKEEQFTFQVLLCLFIILCSQTILLMEVVAQLVLTVTDQGYTQIIGKQIKVT
jgi:hypothetical protein